MLENWMEMNYLAKNKNQELLDEAKMIRKGFLLNQKNHHGNGKVIEYLKNHLHIHDSHHKVDIKKVS